jgi:cyanophycinase-like exopeptidase
MKDEESISSDLTINPVFNHSFLNFILKQQEKLNLSTEQIEKLKKLQSVFAKETFKRNAELQLAEIELNELQIQVPLDLEKVDAKLRQIEAFRTELRLAYIQTIEKEKAVLKPEQQKNLEPFETTAFLYPAQEYFSESSLRQQIQTTLKQQLQDRKVVEIETAEAIATRLSNWAKLLGFFVGIPLAVLTLLLGFVGIKTYNDLDKTRQEVVKTYEQRGKDLKLQFEKVEAEVEKFKAQLTDWDQLAQKVNNLNTKVENLADRVFSPAVWHELDGNAEDVNPQLMGPVYLLGGGGADVDRGIQWMIDQVRGCEDCSKTVDLVVLRLLTDTDQEAWDLDEEQPSIQEDYLGYHELLTNPQLKLRGLDSIETFVFTNPTREVANQTDIAEAIEKAEVILFAGGDQCNYARNFRGNKIESAIESVQARGGAIGGTSAGAMIQGEWIFNACVLDAVTSDDALANPYKNIPFTENLFPWSALKGTIVETHFYQRDRMGRAMTFVARLLRDGITNQALAIGIDEKTSLLINQQGIAQVMTDDKDGSVYFILGDHQPDVCEPEMPLSFSDYRIWRVRDGETFDLKNIPTTGYYQVSVSQGRISVNPYRRSN